MKNLKPITPSVMKRHRTLLNKAPAGLETPSTPSVEVQPAPVKPQQVLLANGEPRIPNAKVVDFNAPSPKSVLRRTTRDIEVLQFCAKHKLVLSQNELWYKCNESRAGEIRGIPSLRGTPRITNGILAWFERVDGSLFDAHLASFIADRKTRDSSSARQLSRLAKLFASI